MDRDEQIFKDALAQMTHISDFIAQMATALNESRRWNWLDWEDVPEEEHGCLPSLSQLPSEIDELVAKAHSMRSAILAFCEQVDAQPLGSQVQPESSVAVCAICDIAGCEHLRGEVTGCTMFTAKEEQK